MKLCPVCGSKNKEDAAVCGNPDCQSPFSTPPGQDRTELFEPEAEGLGPGDVISGRYEVQRELGRGGMGVVYLVRDTELRGLQMALKMTHPGLVAHEEARQRFKDEVILCLELRHDNIVPVHHLDEWKGHPYFTMAYIQGPSLRTLMKERKGQVPPFALEEVIQVAGQILDALAYAHQTTIHRDIKPENLIVEGEFPEIRVMVLDFGIAKTLSASRFTRTDQSMGTAYYMSPEQMQGAKDIDCRSDLYSVGMIIYEMLTGEMAVGRFDLPCSLVPDLPPGMDPLIEKVLSPRPENRHESARNMKDDLLALEESTGIGAVNPDEGKGPDPSGPSEPEHPKAPRPGKKLSPALLLVCFLILACTAGYFGIQQLVPGGIDGLMGGNQTTGAEEPPSPEVNAPKQAAEKKETVSGAAIALPALTIQSVPTGAQVYVDGGHAGQSPVKINTLASGTHEIKLSLARYQEYTQTLFIQENSPRTLEARLVPKPFGSLAVKTRPPGAWVYIDETLEGRTPLVVEKIKKGSRKIRISLADYDSVETQVDIRPLETASVERDLVSSYGSLEILSHPSGAAVTIDGKKKGTTPLALENVRTGGHTVTVGKACWKTAELSVKVKPGQMFSRRFDLTPACGSIHVTGSPEGARVLLDGKGAGAVPEVLDGVAEGRRTLVVEKKGYTSIEQMVQVKAGKTLPVKIALEKVLSRLYVDAAPSGTRVRVLNIKETFTQGMALAPGRYEIEVSKTGYESQSKWVEVGASPETRVTVTLKSTGPEAGDTWTDSLTGMAFVYVPSGCFEMGQSESERQYIVQQVGQEDYDKYYNDETPIHKVCLEGFWMGKYEVTNRQYRQFKSKHDSGSYQGEDLNGDSQPVVKVSWEDAKAFISWLNKKSSHNFALPSEAQWEYAARGGTSTIRFWGDEADLACGWANVADKSAKLKWSKWTIHNCSDGYAVTSPVGRFRPNGFGLYDMLGNVWEWCEDVYDAKAYAKPEHGLKNPLVTSGGSFRVRRGGGWNCEPAYVRCARRSRNSPSSSINTLGFRLIRKD